MEIRRAQRRARKARIALSGPAGSGKTYTALRLAMALSPDAVGVIDTESGSALDYAEVPNPDGGRFDFSYIDLSAQKGKYSAENHLAAIAAMAQAKVACLIIDSLSHAWAGAGGMLEMVDRLGASKAGGKFAAWADVTPLQNQLVEAILAYPGHVICTLRSKVEWVLEQNDRGRAIPRKVGTAPVQRDGIDYEFALAGELDLAHNLTIHKSRTSIPVGSVWSNPGADLGAAISDWLNTRIPTPQEVLDNRGIGVTVDQLNAYLASIPARSLTERTPMEIEQLADALTAAGPRGKLQAWLEANQEPVLDEVVLAEEPSFSEAEVEKQTPRRRSRREVSDER